MKLLEVRDGFIKVELSKEVSLSSFLLIEDALKSYIAQISQIKLAGENNIGYAKLLFLYNEKFLDYDNSLPSMDSIVKEFVFENFNKNLEIQKPIIVGNFIQNNDLIKIDESHFDKKTLLVIDSTINNQIIVKNIAKQFKKSLIIDTLGIFKEEKVTAGIDFKIPLNAESLQFIYEDCLNDATSDSKQLVKEIFQDLLNYSKEIDFIPFGVLKSIIDNMVDKNHIFKLLVLKNKLNKFDKLGYFASNKDEAKSFDKILSNKNAVLDLSNLDPIFQNRYLSFILSQLKKNSLDTQVFVELANSLNKKTLKEIITGKTKTTLITNSNYRYLKEIKPMFKNFIIEATFLNKENFKHTAQIINFIPKETCLVIGEGTKNVPLISSVSEINLNLELIREEEPERITSTNDIQEDTNISDNAIDLSLETNASINAINEKSEILIQQVSEEIDNEPNLDDINLFDTDNSNNEVLKVNNNQEILSDIITENEVKDTTLEISNEDLKISSEEVNIDDLQASNIELLDEKQTVIDTNNEIESFEEILDTDNDTQEIIEIVDHTELESEIEANSEIIDQNIDLIQPNEQLEPEELNSIEVENIDFTADSSIQEDFEIIELEDSSLDDIDVLVELDESIEETEKSILDKQITEDVDRVFTTMKEDNISDSDLDFIDELNSIERPMEEIPEEVVLSEEIGDFEELIELNESDEDTILAPIEEIKDNSINEKKGVLESKNSTTPIVPIYEAEIPKEDLVISDTIEQGDMVMHAKYGKGIVEKMVKYGTKTLFSINFQNSGRTLLDPTITELKKC